MSKQIYCCGCSAEVTARLTNGKEIYPHRRDLYSLPFWKCDTCKNFVGCHHKTKNPTMPLGCIPTPAIKKARNQVHARLDPLWQGGLMTRKDVYAQLAGVLNETEYHTANIRSIDQAYSVLRKIDEIKETLTR